MWKTKERACAFFIPISWQPVSIATETSAQPLAARVDLLARKLYLCFIISKQSRKQHAVYSETQSSATQTGKTQEINLWKTFTRVLLTYFFLACFSLSEIVHCLCLTQGAQIRAPAAKAAKASSKKKVGLKPQIIRVHNIVFVVVIVVCHFNFMFIFFDTYIFVYFS